MPFVAVEFAVRVDVARFEHHANRDPADRLAGDPRERPQPRRQLVHVEAFARRKRVEVAGHDMQAVLVALDAAQQRAQFVRAPLLGQVAVTALRCTP